MPTQSHLQAAPPDRLTAYSLKISARGLAAGGHSQPPARVTIRLRALASRPYTSVHTWGFLPYYDIEVTFSAVSPRWAPTPSIANLSGCSSSATGVRWAAVPVRKTLVGDIYLAPVDMPLHHLQAQLTPGKLDHAVAGYAGQHVILNGRGVNLTVRHKEKGFSPEPSPHVAVLVQDDGLVETRQRSLRFWRGCCFT